MRDIRVDQTVVCWQQRASVWLGIGINPASISTGGGVAMWVPPRHLFWVLPLSVILLILLSMAQGLLGQQQRARLAQLALATFGRNGAGLLNLLMAIGLVGWSGFHGGVSGASMAALLHLPPWLGALLIFVLLYLLNRLGINRWAALTWITTGAALALTIFALATVSWNGSDAAILSQAQPAFSINNVLRAVSTIIGYATLFSLRTPDFTWDFASRADVIKVKFFLFFPLLFGMSAGALLYRATGNWNIADILAQSHSAMLGHLFLIVAVISPLISGWYSGAFALSYLTPLKPNQSILLICLLGFFWLPPASTNSCYFFRISGNGLGAGTNCYPAEPVALIPVTNGSCTAGLAQWRRRGNRVAKPAATALVRCRYPVPWCLRSTISGWPLDHPFIRSSYE
ncbi:MAG: hypothetical protein R2932_17605 [Caldilineaceae bacterium]